jgi:hypothetical protein
MSAVDFFDAGTGLWTGVRFSGSEADIALNAPAGSVPVAAVEFPWAMRLDADTGTLVDYKPPAPSPDHDWNAQERRWVVRPAVLQQQSAKRAALEEITRLELSQLRLQREERIGRGGLTPLEIKKRLEDIDDQIIALRAIVNQ